MTADDLSLTAAVDNTFEGDPGSFEELRNTSLLRGAGIILIYAWLESNYNENRWRTLTRPPNNWQHFDEWRNLYLIRHCFAHSLTGTLLQRHEQDIRNFHTRLHNGEFRDLRGRVVEEYYRFNNNRIILDGFAVRRSRSLCHQFLQQFTP